MNLEIHFTEDARYYIESVTLLYLCKFGKYILVVLSIFIFSFLYLYEC